jgi:thiamine-phosphate pyrophosphorylase
MILITNPTLVPNEMETINTLFEEGLDLLHIRKPDFSEMEMAQFIIQIKMEFRDKLVLHQHHSLSAEFGINRIHNSVRVLNNDRVNIQEKIKLSTSTHSIEEFNQLPNDLDYAFLSPVFPSISKQNYYSKTDLFKEIKNRTNFNIKLIALGGMASHNIKTTLENGFDDVALLGTIWNSKQPIKNFKLCQQNVLS